MAVLPIDAALGDHAGFIGRANELAALQAVADRVRLGEKAGAIAVVSGEAGIGKTRLVDELVDRAAAQGFAVFRGGIEPGAPRASHAAFRSAIESYARIRGVGEMLGDFGPGAGALAHITPMIDDLGTAVTIERLDPDEERLRVLDSVARLVRSATAHAPTLFALDDLQWADSDAVALVQRVARVAATDRLLVLLAHRDESFDGTPAAHALADLRQRGDVDRVRLIGWSGDDLRALLEGADAALTDLLEAKTDGNPFLVRHLLAHLIETGRVTREDGNWSSVDISSPGVPLGVQDVVRQRTENLSEPAQSLLTTASAFDAPFPFSVVAAATELPDAAALDALDDTIAAGLLRPASGHDQHAFTHALVRDAIYSSMSATRQIRLHHHLAETMAHLVAPADPLPPSIIAEQYARSVPLSGAERGVPWAVAAADAAEQSVAFAAAAAHVSSALTMLPADDDRRPQLLARRALNEAYGGDPGRAVAVARDAAAAINAADGSTSAVEAIQKVATALEVRGYEQAAWDVARLGLELSDERTAAWAKLTVIDHRRAVAEDPSSWGRISDDVWDDLKRLLLPLPINQRLIFLPKWNSRTEALAAEGDTNSVRLYYGGDLRTTLPRAEAGLDEARQLGGPGRILGWASTLVRIRVARGMLAEGAALLTELDPLVAAMTSPTPFITIWLAARDEMRLALDEGWDTMMADFTGLGAAEQAANSFAAIPIYAALGRAAARTGDAETALGFLSVVMPALEALPGWYLNYTRMACDAAEIMWFTRDTTHVRALEHLLATKVIEPDFRFPSFDARHAMARLAAIDGRVDEARSWFARARDVLREDLAEPLLAIVDHDEGVVIESRQLLERAKTRFEELGMSGWERRAATRLAR